MRSECTGRERPDGGRLDGQIRECGGWRRNRRRWSWCWARSVHGSQHGSVGGRVGRRELGARPVGRGRCQDMGQVQNRLARASRQEPSDLGHDAR